VIVLGHRGGRGEGWPPENSLEAFRRALDEGADGVELDVRLCATGEPVLLHDPALTDGRRVHALPRAELPPAVADLADALDVCTGRLVNVEVKPDVPRRLSLARAVVRTIARARNVDVVLSSFDPAIVLACAALAPRVRRAILVGPRTPRLGTALPLALRRVVSAAHLEDALLHPKRIERLRSARLGVVAWTINDAERAQKLAALGVGCIITDRPAAIVRALATR
jgi:glycerophosphoryl diester phosphodiesterase